MLQCRNAFKTLTARGVRKHTRSAKGMPRGDGRRCGDDSGGFRRQISRVVKEERPRKGSTSWSLACVQSDVGDGERGRRNFCVISASKVINDKITFVYH